MEKVAMGTNVCLLARSKESVAFPLCLLQAVP